MKIFKVRQAYFAFMTLILSIILITGCGGSSDNPGRGSILGVLCSGAACVDLGAAGDFVVLAENAITDTGSHSSVITGNIGLSSGTGAAIGVTCEEMTGKIYTVDAAYVGSGNVTCVAPGPGANKTFVDGAVGDMGTAYTTAAGLTPGIGNTNLYGGILEGQTLAPGIYKWTTDVTIGVTATGNLTLSGSSTDVWIFQIAGDLTLGSKGSVPDGIKVLLTGGAQPQNIFWQVGGGTGATLGTYSTFNGIILSAMQVIMQTGAVFNGRAFAQTQVTLDANVITAP